MKPWRKPFDLEEKSPPSGKLEIIKERCKGCGFCVEFCPQHALQLSEEFNQKGYHPPVMIQDKTCLMCGLCEIICPEFAIYQIIDEVPDKPDNAPESPTEAMVPEGPLGGKQEET